MTQIVDVQVTKRPLPKWPVCMDSLGSLWLRNRHKACVLSLC